MRIHSNVYHLEADGTRAQLQRHDRSSLRFLDSTDPRDVMRRIQGDEDHLVEGTCTWVLETPLYKSWAYSPNSVSLWIHGHARIGKTMLILSQSQHLQRKIKPAAIISCMQLLLRQKRFASREWSSK